MSLHTEIKNLIISTAALEDITPDDIGDEDPLFGGGLGLDSIDALEIGVALRKKYNIQFSAEDKENKQYFASVNALASFISMNRNESPGIAQ